ncbi:hypothetical protein Tco_1225820 [Tanacetum coccineum]
MVARLPKTGWLSLAIFLKSKVASPEQTAIGKDKSNPFMAVMNCQKSYSSSTYYDSCSESGKWFRSSMDLTLSGLLLELFQDVAVQSSDIYKGRSI